MVRQERVRPASLACASAVALPCTACAKKEPARLCRLNGTGKLVGETNVATIKGDEVTGWMDGMTMEYPVQDRNEYRALHAGEKYYRDR